MKTDPQPSAPARNSERQPIPVASIWFEAPGAEIPGKGHGTAVSTVDSNGRPTRWRIMFRPWLRSFEVTYTPPDSAQAPQVRCYHESRVSWQPAAE